MQMHGGRKACSPTAQLLRSSRLFALPEPLPRPVTARRQNDSHNTTLPYPTRQAIETPLSSQARGDYGFKRNLPLKRIQRNGQPVVRLVELDSIEKITDYEFAADHTQALKKIQELDLGVNSETHAPRTAMGFMQSRKGAFEDELDNTTLAENRSATDKAIQQRWKYASQRILGASDATFQGYIDGLRRGANKAQSTSTANAFLRNESFLNFLREKISAEYANEIRAEQGKDAAVEELSEEGFQNEIKRLRDDFIKEHSVLSSSLHGHIIEFLDLPPLEKHHDHSHNTYYSFADSRSTHPSAGLSYLKTNAVLTNHPLYGPQPKRRAIPARLLQETKGTHRDNMPAIGVAGVVTKWSQETNNTKVPFQPDQPGGHKLWVQAEDLHIANDGTIRLAVSRATEPQIGMAEGRWPFVAQTESLRRRNNGYQGRSFGGIGDQYGQRPQASNDMYRSTQAGVARFLNRQER